MTEIRFTIPLRTRSASNLRVHWSTRAERVKAERSATRYAWLSVFATAGRHPPLPCVVTLVRVAPRPLDTDNLAASCKGVRDQVAAELGVDDSARSPVRWDYGQRKGKPREYAVEVTVGPMAPCRGCGKTPCGEVAHEDPDHFPPDCERVSAEPGRKP